MEVAELNEPLNKERSLVEEFQEDFSIPKSEKQKKSEYGGKIIWRGANAMMTAFFVMASGVQFNDPDPFLWVPLYGAASILTLCITIQPNLSVNKLWKGAYCIHTAFCIGMFFYVLVELVIVATNPQADGSLNPLTYEEGREMAGIMITIIWLFTCMQSPTISYDQKQQKNKKRTAVTVIIVLFSVLPLFMWYICYSNSINSSCISVCNDFYLEEFSF